MKKIKIAAIFLALAFLAVGCNSSAPATTTEGTPQSPDQNSTDPGFTEPQPSSDVNYRGVQQSQTQKLNDSLNQMKAGQPQP
jgi:hypothetical protein